MTNHLWRLTEDAMHSVGFVPKDVTITILGWSSLKNSTNIRNSPAISYKDIAERSGSKVYVYDPVCGMGGFRRACASDVFVVITNRDEFQSIFATLYNLRSKRGKPLIMIDGITFNGQPNAIEPEKYIGNGWIYRAVGGI